MSPPVRSVHLALRGTTAPELKVAPGAALRLHFDGAIVPDAVKLEGRIERLYTEGRVLTLVLSRLAAPGERATLGVRFADGVEPTSATLSLVAQPEGADTEVWVERGGHSAVALREELARCQTQAADDKRELTERLLELEAQCTSGFTDLLLSGEVDDEGLLIQNHPPAHFNGISLREHAFLRSRRRVVMLMKFSHLHDDAPWAPGKALLTNMNTGAPGETPTVRMQPPLLPAGILGILIVEMKRQNTPDPFRLDLRGRDGKRLIVLEGVRL